MPSQQLPILAKVIADELHIDAAGFASERPLKERGERRLANDAAAHFFFHMQDVEAQDVARAMSVITPRSLQFIIDAEPGQCLGVIRKDAYEINVECHPLEASAFLNS